MGNKLDNFRKQIDEIDEAIISLLGKRQVMVKKIGSWKKKRNISPLDKKRWLAVLKKKIELANKLGLDANFTKKIFTNIHNQSLKIEKSL